MHIYATGNSHTKIAFNAEWLVLDVGSGHNPHPRADVLIDKYIIDDPKISGRSGRGVKIPNGKMFVIGDICALPFANKAFDFIICSHVAEHVANVDDFCREMIRVSSGGYIETPSKIAEVLRHPPYHIWYVFKKRRCLFFQSIPLGYPLKWFGKLFFSVYFYKEVQLSDKDVFSWAFNLPQPFDTFLLLISKLMRRLWILFKSVTYTRFFWRDSFEWRILKK